MMQWWWQWEREKAEWTPGDLPMHASGSGSRRKNYRVGEANVFVVGSALRPAKMAIRVLGQGKEVTFSVDQFLRKETVIGESFHV